MVLGTMTKISFKRVWNDLINVLEKDRVVYTLYRKCRNEVADIFKEKGIQVITKRSSPKSHLVPKWMFEVAVNHIREHGSLSNPTLLNTLNVKRSSFVMAALSKLDYIEYKTTPIRMFFKHR